MEISKVIYCNQREKLHRNLIGPFQESTGFLGMQRDRNMVRFRRKIKVRSILL